MHRIPCALVLIGTLACSGLALDKEPRSESNRVSRDELWAAMDRFVREHPEGWVPDLPPVGIVRLIDSLREAVKAIDDVERQHWRGDTRTLVRR
jgi:hypothetical protein